LESKSDKTFFEDWKGINVKLERFRIANMKIESKQITKPIRCMSLVLKMSRRTVLIHFIEIEADVIQALLDQLITLEKIEISG